MALLSISKQIYLVVGFVLMLLAVLAAQSFLATAQLAGIFTDYKATAHQTLLTNELFEDVFNAQFAAFGYRLTPSDHAAQAVWNRVEDIADGQRSAEQIFMGDDLAFARLQDIAKSTKDYRNAFAQMTELKTRSDAIITEILAIGTEIREKLTAIMNFAYENGDTWVGYDVGVAQQEFMRGRFHQERYLITNDLETFEAAMGFVAAAKSHVESLYPRIYDPETQTLAQETIAGLSAYVDTARRNRDIIAMRNEVRDQKLDTLGPEIKKNLEDLVDIVVSRQNTLGLEGSSSAKSTLLIVTILSISALCIGSVLAVFVARRISGSVSAMADTMTELAGGNLDVDVGNTEHEHELGMMTRALEVFKANAEDVRRSLEKERELSKLQRQFVSMVSHEFRTPLAIIDGHAQRFERRPEKITTERVLKSTKTMRTSVMRLTELMESMLSAARMEGGQIEFQPAVFDIGDMVNDICRSYTDISTSHHIEIDTEALPATYYGDVKLLRQVVSNLVSNAVKYSPENTTVFVRGFQADDKIVISVRDQGVGIPGDEVEKLFQQFFRASTSTGIPGTGIGLHLVKQLVAIHGGDMSVESVVGQGTTFEVLLPAVLSASEALTIKGSDGPSCLALGYETA